MKRITLTFLLVMALWNLSAPAGASITPASGEQSVAEEKLLQFTSGGHVLGFGQDAVIVAGMDRMLRVEFVGGRPVRPVAQDADTAETAQPLSQVTYSEVWEGVDVVYRTTAGGIFESVYRVRNPSGGPGAEHIRLRYNRPVSLDGQGNLVTAFSNGNMIESAPMAWQEVGGARRPVQVAFVLRGECEVGFDLSGFFPGISVTIDPLLTWNNTFLGGTGTDYGNAIAVDGSGNVYVGGPAMGHGRG